MRFHYIIVREVPLQRGEMAVVRVGRSEHSDMVIALEEGRQPADRYPWWSRRTLS